MNKFIFFALLVVFPAVVLANEPGSEIVSEEESQLALVTNNEEECSGLSDQHQVFSSFCLATRDYVLSDLKKNANSMAANGFTLFFKSAEAMGIEAIDVQRKATNSLSSQIRNPESSIDGSEDSNRIDQLITRGQERVQQSPNLPKSLVSAIGSTVTATASSLAQNVMTKLNELKSVFGLMQIVGALSEACNKVSVYEEEIRRRFQETKAEIAERDPSLAYAELEAVNCVTSKRILRVEGLCKFARIAQNPLMRMLTYRN